MRTQFRQCLFAAVIVFLSSVSLATAEDDDDGDVVVLTADNFESKVASLTQNDAALLVEFYAPWCGHCKSLAPKYKEAAAELIKEDPPLYIAKMDADDSKNKEVASKYEVSGFPTLKFFKDGGATVTDFQGGREKADIVKAVKSAQGPSWEEVKSFSEVESKIEEGERVVLFAGKEPRAASKAFTTFKNVAAQLKGDFIMLATFSKDVIAEAGLEPPAIQVMTKYKPEGLRKEATSNQLADGEKMQEFLAERGKPLVAVTTNDVDTKLLHKAKVPILYMVVDSTDATRKNMFRNRLTKVAAQYKGKVGFAVTDDKDSVGSRVFEDFGLEKGDLPAMVIRGDPEGNSKFRHAKADGDSLKVDGIKAFVDDFLAGNKLEKYIKSEPVPSPASKDEPVQVVVGKNFEEVVLDKTKNVLLEMYAPWCGHCKKLEPEYKAAAKKLWKLKQKNPSKYGSVVLAKMDATANDSPHPQLQARGYPTIKFVRSGNNEVVDFSGERDSAAIVDWVKTEAAKSPV